MDSQTREYANQNLTLPHDVVPLPSGGIFYKNKKQSVKVGYLTASDENILLGNTADIATSLLRSKIYEPDIRVEDLLEGDVEAILIFLRNTSFGPEMTINCVDPATKKEFKSTILLDELNIKKGVDPDSEGHFNIRLPKTDASVKLKPLTYGEVQTLNKTINSYPQNRIAPVVTLRLQQEIIEINGSRDLGDISKFIEQMPIADSKYIRKFIKENEPRLDMTRIIIAPSGEKLTVNVGFGAEFFRPFF
jgi:hypothetical protein